MINHKSIGIWISLIAMLTFFGCGSDDVEGCNVRVDFDGSTIRFCPSEGASTTLDRPQDEFIWQAMNLFYFWQDEVGVLADDRFSDFGELFSFLNQSSSSENLFNNELLAPNDRFSAIFDDYIALENSFQGISTSFGYDFGLLRESPGSTEVFGYVRYVVAEGPADRGGLKRGDLFTKVNDIQLTESNFAELLFNSSAYNLTLAKLDGENIVSTDVKIDLIAEEVNENPIFLSKIIDLGGTKVGYLVYNQFVNNNERHRQLNEAFLNFRTQGISHLVLDLRYNPGGSVTTTRILSSLIYGAGSASENLGTIVYNQKLSETFNTPLRFRETLPIFDANNEEVSSEPLSRLSGLAQLFVLTSSRTASASELLIVGLDPYMDVTTIGTTTVGKNEGSLTLYDNKPGLFLDRDGDGLNQNHRYAIQPIVSKLANSEGFTDYEDGLAPDILVDELDFLSDLKLLGDLEEPLLAEALAVIQGTARSLPSNSVGVPIDYKSRKQLILEKTIIEPQYL
ncbi:MAG: S41 family peptidase, partial [Bacteroidota bacterium]